jgi:hypothetical protein
MTPQQQTDLQLWKQDQSQPLPKSLANALIEDCLDKLKNNEEARNRFNSSAGNSLICHLYLEESEEDFYFKGDKIEPEERVLFDFYADRNDDHYSGTSYEYHHLVENEFAKINIIQTLLSRTPDGQAVMPFLNSEIKDDKLYDKYGEKTILQCTRVWYAWEVGTMTEEDFDDCVVNDEFIAEIAELYNAPQTLDHLLHREFTEALRVGKTFDEALKIINLIYCQNAQNKQN